MNVKHYGSLSKRIVLGASLVLLATGSLWAVETGSVSISPHADIVENIMQQKTIKGAVLDVFGEPIIGANVIVKGTVNGVITDIDGNFTLVGVSTGDILLISYIGYISQEIKISANITDLKITLKEDAQALDEVVVVGYGSEKKVNLTGSVNNINVADLAESRPITDVSQGLAGMAAGVQVTSSSNKPGENTASIMVRGQGTLNNSAPLVIIDGVEGSLSSVQPQDIESLSVLKDAASAAIYGSRAANGVILITTRTGKQGKVKVEYNGYISWESVGKTFDLVSNYADYMELINEGLTNSNLPTTYSTNSIDLWRQNEGKDALKYPNTNLMDAMFETSLSHNHNVSISGGSDKIRFYTSFGFLDNPGVMENSGYKKSQARINLDMDVASWLKLGANINGYVAFTEPGTDKMEDIFTYAAATSPGMVFRASDGRFGATNNGEDDPQNAANNPLYRLYKTDGENQDRYLKARFYGTLVPLKGLTLTGSFNYMLRNKTSDSKPVFIEQWNFQNETVTSTGIGKTSFMDSDYKWNNYLMDVTATYQNKVSKLDYSIMTGASQELFRYKWFKTTKQDLIDPGLGALDGAVGAATSSGNMVEWVMRSYFGRIKLNWDNKYLVEANFRADGSSRFLKGNRWGYFPSASAAWRISEEPFIKDFAEKIALSNLKLRASYGMLGNNTLRAINSDIEGNYDAQALYGASNYVLNSNVITGLAMLAIPNANLTWEKTKIFNAGIDFSFFANRLSGTLEYFHKKTEDILIDLPAPLVNGNASIPRQNAGVVVNKGVEVSLGWHDQIKDFSYFINGNVTFIKNKVTKFKGNESAITNADMIKEGHPINVQYGYVVDRIVQTEEDLAYIQQLIDNTPIDPATGKVKKTFPSNTPELGDLLYKDINGDGVINDDDRTVIGNGATPKCTFGLNLGGAYKGFDFSVLLQGVTGVETYWLDNYFRPSVRHSYQLNKEIADGRWHEGIMSGTAKYPRLLEFNDNRNTLISDFWIQNRSFLKIKNIQLGYSFSKSAFPSLPVERIRIYGSLENFFTFTKYDGLDPEVDGVDYPAMKQAVIGINLSF